VSKSSTSILAYADLVYSIGILAGGEGAGHGQLHPLAASAFAGKGQVEVPVHATYIWKDAAVVATLCARRLRQRLGMRDLWAPDLDLLIGKAPFPTHAPTPHMHPSAKIMCSADSSMDT
jgi:hypothetical protein